MVEAAIGCCQGIEGDKDGRSRMERTDTLDLTALTQIRVPLIVDLRSQLPVPNPICGHYKSERRSGCQARGLSVLQLDCGIKVMGGLELRRLDEKHMGKSLL